MPQQDSSNRLYDFPDDDNQDRLPVAPLPATGGGTSVAIRQVPHDVGTTLAPQSQINLTDVQPIVEQAKYNLTPVDSNPFTEAMDYPIQAATDFAKFLKRNLIDAPVQAITEEGRILHQSSRPVDPSTLTYPPQPKSLNQIYQEAGPFGKMAITGAAEPYLLPKNLIYEPIKAAKDLTQQMAEGTFNPTSKEDVSRSLLAAGLGGTGGLVGVPEGSAISGLGFKQLLDKQRELENMRAAIRDPDTRKIYAGKIGENLDHSDIINNITDPAVKQKFMDDLNSENPDFKKFGFLDHRGKFVSRDTLDQQYGVSDTGQLKNKLNMFRSDTSEASQAEQALQKIAKPNPIQLPLGKLNKENIDKIGDYIYHRTNNLNDINQISQNGLQPQNYKHNYFFYGENAEKIAESYQRDYNLKQNPGDILRINKKNFPENLYNSNQNVISTPDTISANAIERKTANGWQPLKSAPTFYSAVENAVNNIKQTKAPAEQWLSTIQNSKGVKSEEIDWIGLKDYLNENKGKSITKQEIQDYVNANKVQLQEVNKGEGLKNWTQEDSARLDELEQKNHGGNITDEEENERQQLITRENANSEPGGTPNITKHSKWQLPGGQNYREKLLTLPNKIGDKLPEDWNIKREPDGGYYVYNTEGQMVAGGSTFSQAESNALYQISVGGMRTEGRTATEFRSTHFDEPNILAHVRMNDRTIEGKKSLHMEEIQSDWLQKGRKEGFKNQDEAAQKYFEKNYKDLDQSDKNFVNEKISNAVPDAPFKKTWHELVLKRMIREAAEKGYDRLSWTPGEAQAERYDLSKQVDTIQAKKNNDGTFDLHYRPLNDAGFSELGKGITKEKLAESVGKDLADKITNQDKEIKSYKGLDLKVGGEGMKGFYDQIIPKALEKISRQKVKYANLQRNMSEQDVRIESDHTSAEWNALPYEDRQDLIKKYNKAEKVPYIDIPQSLKDTAMQKGFPLFSSSGAMFVPIDHNPHDQIEPLNPNLSRSEAARIK